MVDPRGVAPAETVGTSVARSEDAHLLTGQAEYTDDVEAVDALHLALARSQHAHARVVDVDTSDAAALDGVVAVYTAADLADEGLEARMNVDSPDDGVAPAYPMLAEDEVNFQGQPIAAVVARDRYTAADAAAALDVTYEREDAVPDVDAARAPDAPAVHDAAPDNEAFRWETGDAAETEQAFADAAQTVSVELTNNRMMSMAMEPRAVVARYRRSTGDLRVNLSTQKPHGERDNIADFLDLPAHRVHVRVPDVGGGFGGKLRSYPGHYLTAYAATKHDRPVRWQATRSGDSQSTAHSRHQTAEAELALDDAGHITGLRASIHSNVGGYLVPGGSGVPTNAGGMICGQYDVPTAHVEITGVFTTTTPMSAFRGAGRPEAAYIVERLAHLAARERGEDPVAFRRRNFIEPDQFPYDTPVSFTYDSGDYDASLSEALELADYDALRERQRAAREEGRYLGVGLSCYVDKSGGHTGDFESGQIRMTKAGQVLAHTGTMDNGQGHRTAYAQVVAEELGIPFTDVEVVEGDTDRVPEGRGTGGSRSLTMAGNALRAGARKVVEKARRVAARQFEVGPEDVTFDAGTFHVAGAPDRAVHIQDLAGTAYDGRASLGDDLEPGLEETAFFSPLGRSYPFGTHVAVVEVDPASGEIDLQRFVAVDDVGPRVNPALVDGQVVGGVVQGLGQALSEDATYDENANLVASTFQEYAVPRAIHVPEIETGATVTPSPNNPLGVKGVGEVGTTGAPPAVVNAVVDALAPLGVEHLDMPLTPETVWRAANGP